jgi:hypothetical protein
MADSGSLTRNDTSVLQGCVMVFTYSVFVPSSLTGSR